ncbi:MAG: 30S ribosomal protein S12 methylthiotransferase RimO [Actinobacteria bacterium]|nr:30S ribosomal protein S12 methylthiotransferase RimO [Actinomycetota bacterium]
MSGNRVALLTLGCARNDVDSDDLAARLNADGWEIVDDADDADAVIVNTCGFVESAKKDSIDTILGQADGKKPVVAVGCLAQRYGEELAEALPEAAAVLGFDAYPDIGERLRSVAAGEKLASHTPTDRRKLLPLTPVDRPAASPVLPGHGIRTRLHTGPVESLKIASGCDRRCTFCAIPTFRGAFISRRPSDVIDEARDLVAQGVRELNLVSENSTSYGKDLGDVRLLETVLPELGAIHDDLRVRLAYLQPAEMRPGLVEIIATTPGIAPYFDLSFQHASPTVLRRMKRFGGTDEFLSLIKEIRTFAPEAGIRTNVIVGFPGESDEEFAELVAFLEAADLDAVGVFPYSDEDGTAALNLPDKVAADTVEVRRSALVDLVNDLSDARAEARIGTDVDVLIEELDESGLAVGRALHQGPEDGDVTVVSARRLSIGDVIRATVTSSMGVDLQAEV